MTRNPVNGERSQLHLEVDRTLHREIKSAVVLSEFRTITRLTEYLYRRWLARRRKAA